MHRAPTLIPTSIPASISFQNRQEGLLRQFHPADLLHPLLALFLFFEEFSLSRYVSAVTLGYDVFPKGLYRIPRYDPPAYGRLYDGLHLLDYGASSVKSLVSRRYDGKGVNGLPVYEYIEAHEIPFLIIQILVIHGGITLGKGLQPVEEIQDHICQ